MGASILLSGSILGGTQPGRCPWWRRRGELARRARLTGSWRRNPAKRTRPRDRRRSDRAKRTPRTGRRRSDRARRTYRVEADRRLECPGPGLRPGDPAGRRTVRGAGGLGRRPGRSAGPPPRGRSGPAAANVDSDRPGPFADSDRGPPPELISRSLHAPPIGPVIRPSGPARRPPDKVPGAAISAARRRAGRWSGDRGGRPDRIGCHSCRGREPAGPTQGRDCTRRRRISRSPTSGPCRGSMPVGPRLRGPIEPAADVRSRVRPG